MKTESANSGGDWLLKDLWWCCKASFHLFFIIVALGTLADFGATFYDAYHGELAVKSHAKRAYDMHCGGGGGMPAWMLQECGRQKAVMERGTWSHAYHVSAEHIAEHIPGVAYCRAHPDMCALVTIKFLEVMVLLFYWCPLLFGSALLWYLWPVIVGACLRRATATLHPQQPSQTPLLQEKTVNQKLE